ncbi:hypothetical protein G6F40_013323 [Rhizopus arrhizus]|nr:hypothetical protein G6F40_013323 [Rhizopus arrhizus]
MMPRVSSTDSVRGDLLHILDQIDLAGAGLAVPLAHGAFHFRVAGVADQHHVTAGTAVAGDFEVDLGHQRTGGIEHLQATALGFLAHRLRNAMGAEDHRVVVRHFVQFLDEDRAALLQVVDHEAVVHHFMADVDGRAQRFDRALDDLDRTIDTGTETTRVGEQHIHQFNLPAAAGLRFRIGIIRLFGGLAVEQAKQGDADGPHHDGRIGDVERGPGVAAHVPLDEIDHVAVHLAVDHVADGTADDQRIRHRGLPVAAGGAAQPPGHQAADGDRQRGEEVLLPATGVAQETERRAGVVGAIPVPEAIDDHHRLELRQARQHPGLGPLVQADDGRRQQQPDQGFAGAGDVAHAAAA